MWDGLGGILTMHPNFEQFVAALRDPAQRPGIGLSISDHDAATLLTRADWANEYYSRWIALFPAAPPEPVFTASPTPVASTTPSTTTPSPFGPPPTAVPTAAFGFDAAAAPATAAPLDRAPAARRTLPRPARIALIAVITIVALWIVAGVVNGVVTLTHASATTHTPTSAAATPPPAGADAGAVDPVVFHGLTQTEYDLLEAVLAPQGHTLEEAVAGGADDTELQRLAASTKSSTAKSCSDGEALANGFGNAAFRASFIASYEVTQKATPQQAAQVYDALAAYCGAH